MVYAHPASRILTASRCCLFARPLSSAPLVHRSPRAFCCPSKRLQSSLTLRSSAPPPSTSSPARSTALPQLLRTRSLFSPRTFSSRADPSIDEMAPISTSDRLSRLRAAMKRENVDVYGVSSPALLGSSTGLSSQPRPRDPVPSARVMCKRASPASIQFRVSTAVLTATPSVSRPERRLPQQRIHVQGRCATRYGKPKFFNHAFDPELRFYPRDGDDEGDDDDSAAANDVGIKRTSRALRVLPAAR